jgi:hypothetical protein
MKKWKFIVGGLVLVIIILCMMTFYLNGSNRNFQVQINRMDREHEDLKKDYEKLYAAYYSYDKKVLEILKFSDKVFWTEDSSFYVLYDINKEIAFFAFYKKPRMQKEFFLWPEVVVKGTGEIDRDSSRAIYFEKIRPRVDTLKPHQFIKIGPPLKMVRLNIIPKSENLELEDQSRPGIFFNKR